MKRAVAKTATKTGSKTGVTGALALALTLAGGATTGCGAASPASGITALLRVANAQFVEGPLRPTTSATGPAVSGVGLNNTNVYPGEENFALSGTVTGATALVGLKGDSGYWIVPATLVDPTTTGGFDFSAQLTFSPLIPVGSQTLVLYGVAADGTIGPASAFPLAVGLPAAPTGALVVTLDWDTESDMDLHVVIPNAADPTMPIEIWSKHPVGLPPPMLGVFTDPNAAALAPYLDFDSNAGCVIDGRRQENVIFPMGATITPGTYIVRVDAASLCGQPDAQWQVSATLMDGTQLGFAQWEATDTDTRGTHAAGAGRLAFTFTIGSASVDAGTDSGIL